MSVLDRILIEKREDVRDRKTTALVADLRARISDMPRARGFENALRRGAPMALIAEVKKASPSKGLIAEDFDPERIAEEYAAGGASCISVLTDRDYFMGSQDDLIEVRKAVHVPVLRKDFTVDELCVLETRHMGADCILLIVAALSEMQLQDYLGLALEIGLDCLVEVHDINEMGTALNSGAAVIGVNNRDLRTFVTDLNVTESLAPLAAGRLLVSESSITSRTDVERVQAAGASAVLVGEYLMREADKASAIRRLLGK
ncbi:MAG: indole-3-glycerol phosphate synthase TrpC [Fimbriimonadales bacterium]